MDRNRVGVKSWFRFRAENFTNINGALELDQKNVTKQGISGVEVG